MISISREKETTIIVLFDTPALQVDIKKFQLLQLSILVKKIIICDLSPVLNPEISNCVTAERMNCEYFEVYSFLSKAEIKNFFSKHIENCFYFPLFDDYYSVRFVYYLFSKYKLKYGYINNLNSDIYDMGIPPIKVSERILNLDHIKRGLYNRIIRKLNITKPAELYFYSSDLSREHYYWRCNCKRGKTREIGVHSFDYERFLSSNAFDYKEYAVYLDTFFPYHPDLLLDSIEVNSKKFFDEMNQVLDEIEETTGCKILVASHPRANYSDKEYSFRKERIFYGLTAEMVKGADFILGSWSTTNQMAVMANRPLIIICCDEVWKSKEYKVTCQKQAEFYNCQLIRNCDDVKNVCFELIDSSRYNYIRENYFCVDQSTKPDLWERIIEQVCMIMNK